MSEQNRTSIQRDLINEPPSLSGAKERIIAHTYPDLSHRAFDLYSRIREQIANAKEPIDFGTTALDIGARDGRYMQVIRELGPKKIVAIDPSVSELQEGVAAGLITPEELFADTLEHYAAQGNPPVDSIFIFNINPDLPTSSSFKEALLSVVKPGGMVVTSFVERDTMINYASLYWHDHLQGIKMKRRESDSERIPTRIDYGGGANHFITIGRRSF